MSDVERPINNPAHGNDGEELRVLLVEDSPIDAKLILHELRHTARPITHERVEDAAAMRAALAKGGWHLIISDWSLPRFSALAALDVQKSMASDLPFIIVSGALGEAAAVDAMRAGAHDYVLKDNLVRLVPAVERELRDAGERHERRVQEARFRALIEKSQDGVALADTDGVFFYLSPSAKRILGFTDESKGGDGWRLQSSVHPLDRARVDGMWASLVTDPDRSVTIEFRVVHADGAARWIEGTATNLSADPAVRAIVGNFRDITDRKYSFQKLQASEARFARLAESGIIGIVVSDLVGNVLDVNQAALQMVGYTQDEVFRTAGLWAKMTPPEWSSADMVAVKQLAERGSAEPWEKELFHKDGTRVPVLLGVAMIDQDQSITVLADLTARKQAERALRNSEDQLRQAQKMEAIGRLAGGIAHDFNNLLSTILSYSEILIEDLQHDDPIRADLESINEAGKRAASLTRQLLMFSRQQVVEQRVVDLNTLLTDMDKLLRRLLGEDVKLVSQHARALGKVKIDPSQIEQVVMNLVVNARDAMPTGGQLTIATDNIDIDAAYASKHLGMITGRHVIIRVTDTGTGMDAATQARVFEPFFTTKELGQGTGLGLSTVFGIVKQSGGYVAVQSEPGKGSMFTVYLPRTEEPLDALRHVIEPVSLSGSETILVVEDEEQVRAVAIGILERKGYQVMAAHDAAEAMLMADRFEGTIHLLLTDVVMPHMSGPELAKRISRTRPEMKLLCMSGYTDDAVVRHGVLDSTIAFLQKPLTPESLTRRVREVLG